MRQSFSKVIRSVFFLSSLFYGLLICVSPAQAYWNDSGNEPPPEFFGIQIGADIRDYPELVELYYDDEYDYSVYKRAREIDIFLGDVSVRDDLYYVYDNIIFDISFDHVGDDDTFDRLHAYLDAEFGGGHVFKWPKSWKGFFGLYEVYINFDRYGLRGRYTVRYLPQEMVTPLRSAKVERKPEIFGITLNSHVDNYDFLIPTSSEGEDVRHYELPASFGLESYIPQVQPESIYISMYIDIESRMPHIPLKAVHISAYKGYIYNLTAVVEKMGDMVPLAGPTEEGAWLFSVDYYEDSFLTTFWNSAMLIIKHPNKYILRQAPLAWEAERARQEYLKSLQDN